jgi:hypothetical protein
VSSTRPQSRLWNKAAGGSKEAEAAQRAAGHQDPQQVEPGCEHQTHRSASNHGARLAGIRSSGHHTLTSGALALSLVAIVAIFRLQIGMMQTLAACSAAGVVLHFLGVIG